MSQDDVLFGYRLQLSLESQWRIGVQPQRSGARGDGAHFAARGRTWLDVRASSHVVRTRRRR